MGRRATPWGAGRRRDSGPLCDASPCARPAAAAAEGDRSPTFNPLRTPCRGHRNCLALPSAPLASPPRTASFLSTNHFFS